MEIRKFNEMFGNDETDYQSFSDRYFRKFLNTISKEYIYEVLEKCYIENIGNDGLSIEEVKDDIILLSERILFDFNRELSDDTWVTYEEELNDISSGDYE